MHQGPTAKIIICLILMIGSQAYGQLNTSDEIIETIEDIKIIEDAPLEEDVSNKPVFDEEFGEKKSLPTEATEENITEEVSPEYLEEQRATREEIKQEDQESYEEQLKKNAQENRLERREISPEDLKNFEIDPVEQAKPQPPPMEKLPQEKSEELKAITPPPEPENLEEEISEEISELPVEEPVGEPIQYAPEPTGPVIVYENEKKLTDEQREVLVEKTEVEIEDDPYVTGTLTKKVGDYLKPFRERRPSWTNQIEIGVSQYEPINYISSVIENSGYSNFESFYESADVPMPSIAFEAKKNFSWGAISVGVSGSYYISTQDDAELSLIIPSVRANLYLDTLFNEPYIVPYGTVGYSYILFDESDPVTGLDYSGNSDNFYVGAGILFQLDWLDPAADVSAYVDSGIENTFIFAEARTYLDQGINGIYNEIGVYADFSSLTHVAAGIKLEF